MNDEPNKYLPYILNLINSISIGKNNFIALCKKMFSVEELCEVMEIDRNRYNYLKRTSQLDQHIELLWKGQKNEI